jgi:hypothetical protein
MRKPPSFEQMASSMKIQGAPDHVIERCRNEWKAQQPEFEFVEVMPENTDAFEAFLYLQDQWESPGAYGGRLCLPHTSVLACIHGIGFDDPKDTFRRVLRIAEGARPVLMDQLKSKKHE